MSDGSGDRQSHSAAVGSQHVSKRHRKIISGIKVWHVSLQLKTFIYGIMYEDSYPPKTGKEFFGSSLCFSHSQVISPGELLLFAACKSKKKDVEKLTKCIILGQIGKHVFML